jgi:hypothetical protein
MSYLFTEAELAAMAARYAQRQVKQQAPTPPPPTPPPGFVYQPRTPEQWEKRINQSWQSNRSFRPKPTPMTPVTEDSEIEDSCDNDDSGETPKSKVSSTTPCLCGHPRKDHHTTPESHGSDNAFYCITAHCAVFAYKDGISAPCDCQYFRVAETDAPKFTKPRVGPYDLCGNPACGHFKISHCTASKPGKINRLKPGELAYRILQKDDGGSYGCRHFDLANPNCQCSSTGCSATPDGQNLCECEKFVNPWLVRKTRVAATPRKKRTQKSAFVTGASELLPPGEASATP